MTTTAKPKTARKKRKRKPGGGRKPMQDTVKLMTVAPRGGATRIRARLVFSEDVVEKLLELHDRTFSAFYFIPAAQRLRILRLQFGRLSDINIPGIFVHVEPPSYNPEGYRVRRITNGRRYQCELKASKLGLIDTIPATELEMMWMDGPQRPHGLFLMFPDQFMLPPRTGKGWGPEDNPSLVVQKR